MNLATDFHIQTDRIHHGSILELKIEHVVRKFVTQLTCSVILKSVLIHKLHDTQGLGSGITGIP